MRQNFKNIYFADLAEDGAGKSSVTLAFGERDSSVYERIRMMSSSELRELVGYKNYAALKKNADNSGRSVNAHCLYRIKRRLADDATKDQEFAGGERLTDTAFREAHLQATFRGGVQEPLHAWYPYLEGYSPQFVEDVLNEFMPGAQRILDPFSGGGTTPLTTAKLGRQAFYCELNPLLQALTEAKRTALALDEDMRERVAAGVDEAARAILSETGKCEAATDLVRSYQSTFGASLFFDAPVFDEVLRARSLINALYRTGNPEAGFVELAALSSLIPASRLIRRGDLRFKTPRELTKPAPRFLDSLRDYLRRIARDLRQTVQLSQPPVLVCEDARKLANVPHLEVSGVITSPPYLNGTNYFRNTKIELWFLRALHDESDLSAFRAKAVTAGINDVTVAKVEAGQVPEVRDLIRQLESRAYDRRIPQMVSAYFSDMADVLSAVTLHLVNRARMAIEHRGFLLRWRACANASHPHGACQKHRLAAGTGNRAPPAEFQRRDSSVASAAGLQSRAAAKRPAQRGAR